MTETRTRDLGRFARLALDCITREFPYHLVHVMRNATDLDTPRRMNPAFYGCYDWHSAVHNHWLLVRLLHVGTGFDGDDEARTRLAAHLTPENLATELAYLMPRPGFEVPYGLAWVLQLCAELREWNDSLGNQWLHALSPLEDLAARRISDWLPKLPHPVRSGQHGQTAFALGLLLDWARGAGNDAVEMRGTAQARRLFLEDEEAPLCFEPSGYDFLSPSIAEADLMRRVLPAHEFPEWLGRLLPGIPALDPKQELPSPWLIPAVTSDRSDGKLSHLDGLNLTRAWMLEGIAGALPVDDPRLPALGQAAEVHRHQGIAAVTSEHYAGAHWLASFVVYLETGRGLTSDE